MILTRVKLNVTHVTPYSNQKKVLENIFVKKLEKGHLLIHTTLTTLCNHANEVVIAYKQIKPQLFSHVFSQPFSQPFSHLFSHLFGQPFSHEMFYAKFVGGFLTLKRA